MNSLIVNEIFYSIQGESLTTGVPTVFVRLTGCPLRCSYCDTEYAFTEGKKMSFDEIISSVNKYNCKNITVTGGEPLAQKNTLLFLDKISNSYEVSLETSNALSIKGINKKITIVLDIKTPNSNESDKNIIGNYKYLKKDDQVKFVICELEDYYWAKDYIFNNKLCEICNILISPSHGEMSLERLANQILLDNLPARLQVQLHKFIWSDERGK
jgi:7-carboxy-7-deazaguanine synthase|tara:strand:+ start:238 stop:876 length:639 start_codon:yes stop_codon:yes gene_type:complete